MPNVQQNVENTTARGLQDQVNCRYIRIQMQVTFSTVTNDKCHKLQLTLLTFLLNYLLAVGM